MPQALTVTGGGVEAGAAAWGDSSGEDDPPPPPHPEIKSITKIDSRFDRSIR